MIMDASEEVKIEALKIARNALIAYRKGYDNSYRTTDEDYDRDCKEIRQYFAFRDEDYINMPNSLLFDESAEGLNSLQVFYEIEILIDTDRNLVSLLKRKKGAKYLDTEKEYTGTIDKETLDVFDFKIFNR